MDAVVLALLATLTPLGVVGVLLVYVLLNPEKAEKWGAILYGLLSKLPIVYGAARRQYVRYDLQGRINDFIKRVGDDAPFLGGRRVLIDWVDPAEVTKQAFLADGKVIEPPRRVRRLWCVPASPGLRFLDSDV